jgi:ACS family D-galactonate transporter-like MFS transporter
MAEGGHERDADGRDTAQEQATGSDTAAREQLPEADRDGGPVVPYKALWGVLLLGWVVSYADRTVTGPVIAWMIQTESGFIGDAANPATVGGLVGSMFFWATC